MGLLQRYIMFGEPLPWVLEHSKHSGTDDREEDNHEDDADYCFLGGKIKEPPADIKWAINIYRGHLKVSIIWA